MRSNTHARDRMMSRLTAAERDARAAAVALPVVDVDPRLHAARCQTLGRPIVAATKRAPGSAQATAWRPDEEVDPGALRAAAAAYRAASRAALVSVVMAHGSVPTATRVRDIFKISARSADGRTVRGWNLVIFFTSDAQANFQTRTRVLC